MKANPIFSNPTSSYTSVVRVLQALTVFGLLGLFGFAFYGSVSIVRHCYTDLPVQDMWRAIADYQGYTTGNFSVFLVPHGDHRILFPQLFYAVDALAFHFQQYSLIAGGFVLQAWIAILLWQAFLRTVRPGRFVSLAALFLTGAIVFSRETGVNFVWPILLGWFLASLTTLLGTNFILKASSATGPFPLLASIAFGFIATFSIGSGLAIWPVLIGTALLVRLPLARILILSVSAAAAIVLYSRGMHIRSGAWSGLAAHPLYTLLFVLEYMGMPISVAYPFVGRMASGLSVLCLFGMLLVAISKKVITRTPILSLFGICAAGILTSILTAAGRADFSDYLFLNARQIRYLSGPLIYWASFSLLTVWLLQTFQAGQTAALAFFGTVGLVFAGVSSHLHKWVRDESVSFERAHFSTIALESGVFDRATVQVGLLGNPETVRSDIPYLRSRRLAFYARPETYWMGKPIDSIFSLAHPVPLQFQNLRTNQFGNGYLVTGIPHGLPRDSTGARVLLTNDNKRIIGLGEFMKGELVASLINGADFRTPVFVGFVNPGPVASNVHFYVLWSDHEATPAGNSISMKGAPPPICDNAGFENATLPPWVIGLGDVFIGNDAHTGAHCLSMRGGSISSLVFQDVGSIIPLHVYTVSAWVRLSSGSSGGKAQLWVHDTQGINAAAAELSPTSQWQRVSVSFVGTKSAEVRVHLIQLAGSNQTLDWDDASVAP